MSSSVAAIASATDPLTGPKYEREPNVLRKKLASVVPGTVNLQVLGAGANGSPSAVYLFTDQSRYLFNCGEGTQRLAHEYKTRLSRLEQIFVTRNTWAAIVRSVDVTEHGETALSFVFLDVPCENYLPGLLSHAKTIKDLGEQQLTEVCLVVHFTPHEVSTCQKYQKFLRNHFSPGTQHIYLSSPHNQFSGYAAAHRIQHQLHQLAPRIFPLLGEQFPCQSQNLSLNLKKTKLDEADPEGGVDASTETEQGVVSMTSFHLRPKKGLDQTLAAKLTPEEYVKETHAVPGFTELLAKLKAETDFPSSAASSYPRIIFLGTGSCIPNKTRNVSSILIQTAAEAFMLLDCGEGTYGQIVRLYGSARAVEVLRQLQAVYVSHLHADHHIGLIGLLRERRQLAPKATPLLLLAPRQIEPWLEFTPPDREIEDAHCTNSFGVSLTLKAHHDGEPVKITYSGDTMPCLDLIELGRNSTVLIHEATMEDDLEEEARIKTHSTISQAIQQGRNMGAKHTILTHFSQRYAKCPRLPSVEDMQQVAIAFDNMQVTLEDLQEYHKLYPALLAMYAEYTEELEQRAVKRELKQERKRKLAQT
ncbi:GL11605 [Drosophila persimilis]|uniref:ribonuclease Z n=1 Tax=Drosophila persimilis TaxID=7234 RepID=B4GC40_DROPE|nr:GL11605 [Drosophila persimilis]